LRTTLQQQIGQTREQIYLTGLSEKQTYGYYKNRVDSLIPKLSTADSPERVADLVNQIIGYSTSAWNTLDDNQKLERRTEYLEFFRSLENMSMARTDAIRTSVREESSQLRTDINHMIQRQIAAIEAQERAAAAQEAAARALAMAAQKQKKRSTDNHWPDLYYSS
jgi:hypothetical protein